MLIVIWMVGLGVLSFTFGIAKSAWGEQKYLKVVLCAVLLVVEFIAFIFVKEMWKESVRERVKEEYGQENSLAGEKTLSELTINGQCFKIN